MRTDGQTGRQTARKRQTDRRMAGQTDHHEEANNHFLQLCERD